MPIVRTGSYDIPVLTSRFWQKATCDLLAADLPTCEGFSAIRTGYSQTRPDATRHSNHAAEPAGSANSAQMQWGLLILIRSLLSNVEEIPIVSLEGLPPRKTRGIGGRPRSQALMPRSGLVLLPFASLFVPTTASGGPTRI